MNNKTILVLFLFALAIIDIIIAPINATTNVVSSENKIYSVESKEKSSSLKQQVKYIL